MDLIVILNFDIQTAKRANGILDTEAYLLFERELRGVAVALAGHCEA